MAGRGSILVTGGSGFIGRHLVARLKYLGKTVRVLSASSGFDVLQDKLPLEDVVHVFHLAALTGVEGAWKAPLKYLEVNTFGTAKVLEECRKKGCSVTLLSSFRPGNDEQSMAANPYIFSKAVAEQLCSFYARELNLKAVTLRLTNVYGPGQSTDFLIPRIVAQLLDGRAAEIVVQDLAPRRDYLHVDDAVSGMILSIDAEAGAVFDLGAGVDHSVEDVIQIARKVTGSSKPYRAVGAVRVNEIERTIADTRAAHKAFGWEPKISIESGILSVVEGIEA